MGDVDAAVVELAHLLELEDELDKITIAPADPVIATRRGQDLVAISEYVVRQLAEAMAEGAVHLGPVVRGILDTAAAWAVSLARWYRVPRYPL